MPAASGEGTLTVDRPQPSSPGAAASRRSLFVPAVWLLLVLELTWAIAGVAVAMAGVFSLATVVPVWAALAVAVWIATRPARAAASAPADRSTRYIRAAALAVAVAAVVINGAFPGEHLQTGRDGGTYTATAGWLMSDGGLLMNVTVPPFDDSTGLRYEAAGFHETVKDGPLYAQFMHAFPSMMATTGELAGLDALVRTNALLGGLALLAFYAFGERLARPWAALVAQLALALNLVFVYFTRAPFSELLNLGLLFAGFWALDQAVEQHNRITAYVAGLFLGATFVARLDGLVVLLMIVLALLPPFVRGRLARVAPAALAGAATSCVLALIDLFVFAPVYVELHVQFLVPLGIGFVLVGLIAAGVMTQPGRRAVRAVLRYRRPIATGLAATIVVAGVFAYVVRPEVQIDTWAREMPIGVLQQREGQVVNESRTYAEQSARWLGWYMGWPALAVALAGWAGLVYRSVAQRASRWAPFLLAISGLTMLYITRPTITPDHIWADRRFLPVVIPGLLLCAAWLLARLWRLAAGRAWHLPAHGALAIATGLIVLMPLGMTGPLTDLREEAGLAREIEVACERLGDDAAILLLDEEGSHMHWRMTQPLRAHCGIPAAWTEPEITNERLLALAARAGERTLYLLAEDPASFEGRPVGDHFVVLAHRSIRLEQTLSVPPRELGSYGLDVLAAPVTPASAPPAG